jgi:hypothetical protein
MKMRRWRSWFPQPILARLLVDAAPNITANVKARPNNTFSTHFGALIYLGSIGVGIANEVFGVWR